VFCRSVWLAIAVFCIVFCGPVKKIIELRYDKTGASSSQSLENKLRTYYREKKDIAQLVPGESHQSPHSGLPLFAIAGPVISFPLFTGHCNNAVESHTPASVMPGLPLYLRFRKLQV
jgi:hypothetical protein